MGVLKQVVRWLLYLWSAPNTLVGMLVALTQARYLGLGGPHSAMLYAVRPESWLGRWMASGGVGGLVPGGAAAVTIGDVVILARPEYLFDNRLLNHECRHMLQSYALGPLGDGAGQGVNEVRGGLGY